MPTPFRLDLKLDTTGVSEATQTNGNADSGIPQGAGVKLKYNLVKLEDTDVRVKLGGNPVNLATDAIHAVRQPEESPSLVTGSFFDNITERFRWWRRVGSFKHDDVPENLWSSGGVTRSHLAGTNHGNLNDEREGTRADGEAY